MTEAAHVRHLERIVTLLRSPGIGHRRGWDLPAIARAVDGIPSGIGSESLCRGTPAPAALTRHLTEAAEDAIPDEPDLAFTSAGDVNGRPHLELWRLTAERTSDGGEEHGLYVQRNRGTGPSGPNEHPWGTAMLVLVGEAWEHAPDGAIRQHEPGDLILRPAWTRYRLTVPAEDGPPIVLLATGGTCPVERTARPRPSADERWSEPGPTGVRPEHATGERETGRGR